MFSCPLCGEPIDEIDAGRIVMQITDRGIAAIIQGQPVERDEVMILHIACVIQDQEREQEAGTRLYYEAYRRAILN